MSPDVTFPRLEDRLQRLVSPLFDRVRLFDALHALSLLEKARADVSLAQLAIEARAARKDALPKVAVTLGQLCDRFEASYRQDQVAMRGKARQLRRILVAVCGADMPVAALGLGDVERALAMARAPRTYNGLLESFRTMARWAEAEGLAIWRFEACLRRRPVPWREPAFFAPDKVERVMRLAEAHPGAPGAAVGMRLALGFFAGVRTAEILRARWEDLDIDGGTLRIPRPKGWTRGFRPRLVELEPCAVAWLRAWRDWTQRARRGRLVGGVIVRDAAAFTAWKLKWLAPLGLSWGAGRGGDGRACGNNTMRHTYATMHVGAFRDAAATALNLGHGRSTEMLEKHYRGLVPKAVAERFWRIYPYSTR